MFLVFKILFIYLSERENTSKQLRGMGKDAQRERERHRLPAEPGALHGSLIPGLRDHGMR